ncbi:MAG: precorrin-8X methylmutase [Methanosaeta sp. PtaB.Bin039]|nr:MAG: precorrin-8X methylmutase [Methanosaeta sp. PtaB.Bin039]HQF15571.1 precorrin-8X methylmutase [Methanotrichaceae archaeon]HQI90307.1 precorrin-8X methylmutase [Methanotrichaceae archaeon]HQJ27726.1 precorrin-8X methylmutase [Methanotrichaceae archaeon]
MKGSYLDLGATTPQALDISRKSRELIAGLVGDETLEDRIKQRCVIATGDPAIAETIRFRCGPVEAGLRAIGSGAHIFADIGMVEAGIVKIGHRSPITTFLGKGDEIAKRTGITRTSAGVLSVLDELSGSIVVIGNAPSALMALCERMERGKATPALVIGMPVGFVNAAESKERLRQIEIPSISNVGTRGGTPLAVACINEIINLHFREDQGMDEGQEC